METRTRAEDFKFFVIIDFGVKVAPKMFFAATPQELERGKGYAIETEMKAMPYCTRPSALINLVFSN